MKFCREWYRYDCMNSSRLPNSCNRHKYALVLYQSSHEPLGKQQYQKQLCKSKNPRMHSYTACGLSDNSEDMCNKWSISEVFTVAAAHIQLHFSFDVIVYFVAGQVVGVSTELFSQRRRRQHWTHCEIHTLQPRQITRYILHHLLQCCLQATSRTSHNSINTQYTSGSKFIPTGKSKFIVKMSKHSLIICISTSIKAWSFAKLTQGPRQ